MYLAKLLKVVLILLKTLIHSRFIYTLKMLIISITVRCTCLYLQKIKNYCKINETRFYEKFSTSFSRPPCRGFLNHVSIHGFLAVMTCWYLLICILFTLFFYNSSFIRTLRLKYLHGTPWKQIATVIIPYHDLFFKISKLIWQNL